LAIIFQKEGIYEKIKNFFFLQNGKNAQQKIKSLI
jgi:hypothetical protein